MSQEHPFQKPGQQVVIILSTGRTGTQALAKLLDSTYQQVTAYHEPKPTRHFRVLSNMSLAGKLSHERALRVLRNSRAKLMARIDTPLYVESNWYLFGFLDAIRDLFGNPRILHVVRDPKTYVPSGLNYGTFRGVKALLTRFVPYWYIRPEQVETHPAIRWRDMSHPQRLAYHWEKVNERIEQAERVLPQGDYLRLMYHDIFQGDAPGMRQLLDWLKLPHEQGLIQRLQGERFNASRSKRHSWTKWDQLTRDAVLQICGERMQKYGLSVD